MFKKVTEFFGGLFLPTRDISGERLYEHLKNLGMDAEVIPKGSPDDPGLGPGLGPGIIVPLGQVHTPKTNEYSLSVKLKGQNLDVIQINKIVFVVRTTMRSTIYRIDYIVRDSGPKIQDLANKLGEEDKRRLAKESVILDWPNECVRIYGDPVYAAQNTKTIMAKKERVKQVFLKEAHFPSFRVLEEYNNKGWKIRKMLDSGQSLWD